MGVISNYAVRFHGGPEGSGDGIHAQIHLFSEKNKLAGWIDFYIDNAKLPHDKLHDESIVMSMHLSMMASVVDILRNEKPVYINWQEKLKNAYLGTGQEPVGEGE